MITEALAIHDPLREATERAAERAYSAFVEAVREFSPPVVQTWNELHPRVKAGWIAAAEAARR
jgi:hypothetical protein